MEGKLELLKAMQVLDIKDGDIVAVKIKTILSRQAQENLKTAVAEILHTFGLNIHVIVLEEGMDIGVLRKEGQK